MALPGFTPSMVLVLNTGSCSHQALQPYPSSHMPVPCHTGLLDHTRQFSSVQSLNRVWFFATPWTATHQASLSITNSWSSLKLMSIKLVMPSNHLILCHPLLLLPQSFPASGSFPMSQVFTSGGQSIRVSASALPMNIQGWFPLRLIGVISFQPKGLSRVFSRTTIQKKQFFGAQPSLWSNSHICSWLLEKS